MIESTLIGTKENPNCAICMDTGIEVAGFEQSHKGDITELRDVCECVIKHVRDEIAPKITRKSWHERIERD